MPFSSRQLHAMKAMGIVPWVLRDAPQQIAVAPATETTIAPEPATASVTAASSAPAAVPATTSAPTSLDQMSDWLMSHALASFEHRGNIQACIGSHAAPVLVLVQLQADSPAGSPLTNSDAQLFDAMLEAIDLKPRDVCLCGLASVTAQDHTTLTESQLAAHVAVLVLLLELDNSEQAQQHQFALADRQIPGWRLPHPSVLQSEPHRKRQAWNSLKALRQVLKNAV